MTSEETFPKLLLKNRKNTPSRVAMRKKNFGIWIEYTWEDCYQNIRYLSMGLMSLGLGQGERVCIMGDNDPEWYWAELAVQAAGAIAVGIFSDAIPSELRYIVQHSEASFVFAKDQEQCDKFLEIKDELPLVRNVIYWDPKGMSDYNEPWLKDFRDVQELGRVHEKTSPELFEKGVERTKGSDYAVFCYTSATTSTYPKGAMLTYDYMRSGLDRGSVCDAAYETDEYLSFSPGAWITEQALGIGWWLRKSMTVNFPEEPETVQENLREIGGSYLLFGSRQWENLRSIVQVKINDSGILRRLLYNLFFPVGYKVASYGLEKWQKPPIFWRLLYRVADVVIFRPIRDHLGLSKLREGISAGTLLGPDTFYFFRAMGIPIKDTYGLTEAVFVTSSAVDRVKVGCAGHPLSDTEIRVTDEGEMAIRCENMCPGYYKNAEATERSYRSGWFHTGDAVFIDDDGYMVYQDRVKDMLMLRDGSRYSPTYIENGLKFNPYVKDAMAIGSGRDFVAAIITIDFDNIGKWAEKSGIPYTTFVDLSQKAEVYDLIQKGVERTNMRLPDNVKISKFSLLHKEFDADEGELTRTRKLRRWFLEDRYNELIEAVYSGKDKVVTEAAVKYRDGREGKVVTSVNIRSML